MPSLCKDCPSLSESWSPASALSSWFLQSRFTIVQKIQATLERGLCWWGGSTLQAGHVS